MKKNAPIILLVVILAIVAIFLTTKNRGGTLRSEVGDFAIYDTASVTKIFMADMQGNEVLLKKGQAGLWSLNDSLNARIEGVRMLLNTMSRLAVMAPVPKSNHNMVIRRLATTSIKVEIFQEVPRINVFNLIKLFPHEKLTKVYYVGSSTPDNMGSFMLMEGSDTPFVVYMPGFRGYVSARYTAFLSDWRDHTIFAMTPSQIRSIEIEFPQEPVESFRIDKYGDNDLKVKQLSTGMTFDGFDTTRVIDFINAFRRIRFEESFQVLDPLHKDSIMSQVPVHIIRLTAADGETKTVTTYRRANFAEQEDFDGILLPFDPNRLYAVTGENNELLLVQYFVFDPITRPLSFLLGKPLEQ